jgi:hypothetical protein
VLTKENDWFFLNEEGYTKTKSGHHVIFDVTDPRFCPGKKIPADFDATNGVWFFQPSEWEPPAWGFGFILISGRNHPMAYSPGFATLEDALFAAEWWEVERVRLDHAAMEFNEGLGIHTISLSAR